MAALRQQSLKNPQAPGFVLKFINYMSLSADPELKIAEVLNFKLSFSPEDQALHY